MLAQKILYVVIGIIAGFAAGFYFSNSVNRQELDVMRGELARSRSNTNSALQPGDTPQQQTANAPQTPDSLTAEQLQTVIAKADAAPADTEMQRKVGQGLYLYAVKFNQPELLGPAVRILKRAHAADRRDYDTTVALGNALFDAGQRTDPAKLGEARAYYQQALEMRPNDVNVRTDLGLTYYFGQPPDPQRAIREYRKSLALAPRHEMTLQNLTAALIDTGELDEAQQKVDELQSVNRANLALTDLRAQLARSRNVAKEKP